MQWIDGVPMPGRTYRYARDDKRTLSFHFGDGLAGYTRFNYSRPKRAPARVLLLLLLLQLQLQLLLLLLIWLSIGGGARRCVFVCRRCVAALLNAAPAPHRSAGRWCLRIGRETMPEHHGRRHRHELWWVCDCTFRPRPL